MAKTRLIVAICLALVLAVVLVPDSQAGNPRDPNSNNMYADGGGDSGHPWDDGTTQRRQADSTNSSVTQKSLPLTTNVPALTGGSVKWIGGALIALWQNLNHTRVNNTIARSRRY